MASASWVHTRLASLSRTYLAAASRLRRHGLWQYVQCHFCSTKTSICRPWGLVLDIDGVIIRGPRLIPGSAEAIKMLKQAGVPYAFMTNGGGVTETAKAQQLARLLDDESIDKSRILLSHTPMRELAERYRGRRVLLVGAKEIAAVAESYGFDVRGGMAVLSAQVLAGTQGIWPRGHPGHELLPPVNMNGDGPPIEAVLIMFEPSDWAAELQLLTDVLAGGRPLGAGLGEGKSSQMAAVYASNPDFVWQTDYPVPRLGQGAFLDCLATLWRRRSGGAELQVTEYGKPHQVQFRAAERLLSAVASPALLDSGTDAGDARGRLRRIYMVGDNPAADVRGANAAGEPWRSVLLCTGVYRGGVGGNDPMDPAWLVAEDLRSAVERLLQKSDAEHVSV